MRSLRIDARLVLVMIPFTEAMHDVRGVPVVVVVLPLEIGTLVRETGGQVVRLGAVAVGRRYPVAGRWVGQVSDVAVKFHVVGRVDWWDCSGEVGE